MCLIPSLSLLGLLVDSFFRYPFEVIRAHSFLTSSFTVADMVLLLMPNLHRVITFTLITILPYFIFIFKNWRAFSKSVFFAFFAQLWALATTSTQVLMRNWQKPQITSCMVSISQKTILNFDFKQKSYDRSKKGYNFGSAPILFAPIVLYVGILM